MFFGSLRLHISITGDPTKTRCASRLFCIFLEPTAGKQAAPGQFAASDGTAARRGADADAGRADPVGGKWSRRARPLPRASRPPRQRHVNAFCFPATRVDPRPPTRSAAPNAALLGRRSGTRACQADGRRGLPRTASWQARARPVAPRKRGARRAAGPRAWLSVCRPPRSGGRGGAPRGR